MEVGRAQVKSYSSLMTRWTTQCVSFVAAARASAGILACTTSPVERGKLWQAASANPRRRRKLPVNVPVGVARAAAGACRPPRRRGAPPARRARYDAAAPRPRLREAPRIPDSGLRPVATTAPVVTTLVVVANVYSCSMPVLNRTWVGLCGLERVRAWPLGGRAVSRDPPAATSWGGAPRVVLCWQCVLRAFTSARASWSPPHG